MLIEPLFIHAETKPDALAIIDDAGRYTYQRLAMMTRGAAQVIAGATKNPRIGVLLPSGMGFVVSVYGALAAGKTVVPLNFLLGEREIRHCITDSGIDTVLTIAPLAAGLRNTPLKIIDVTRLPPPPSSNDARSGTTPSIAAARDEIAVLMYTSGTSGLPKGVPLTYANLQSNVDASISHMDFRDQHKFLGIVPLFHAFGMTAMMLAPIQLGATIVYLSRFSPVATVNAIKGHAISIMGGVPSMFAAILRLKDASADDFKTIYAMISGGEPLPAALREAFRARFGVILYEAYGMTETSLAIAVNTPQMHKPGSVGKPIPGMQIKIADDAGHTLPPGQEGEIWVKGPMVMKGYYGPPAETAAGMSADGYFKTGDVGKMDGDGFLYITGRKKDLIIVAGEKVAPREIEEILMSHPTVAEAAVVGTTSATRGQSVTAFVIGATGQSPDPEELRRFCRERGLVSWKIPGEIQVVTDLPRSPTGKVLKRELARTDTTNASENATAE